MSTSHITDLRSYLKALEEAGELSRVKIPVSLDQEIGAICLRNLRQNGPGLLFERPGDGSLPLAVDLMASRRRYALALGIQPEELAVEWNRRTSTPMARRPRDSRATIREISVTASAACCGVICFGSGGVGMSRLAS